MKSIVSLLLMSLLFSCQSEHNNDSNIVLTNVNIINPEQDIITNGVIVIKDSIIKYVGKNLPKNTLSKNTIDLKGKYIIPGLIDSHVHVSQVNGFEDKDVLNNDEIVDEFRQQLPKSYLYFGYTTLVDLGTPYLEALNNFNNHPLRPDLYHVGAAAVIGKGYGLTNWDDKLPNFIYKDHEHFKIPEKYNASNHTVEAVVSRIKTSGAIAVKSYYEPGLDPNAKRMPVPDSMLITSLFKEAHKYKLPLTVHANSVEGHGFLSQHNVDIMAHGLWRWGDNTLDNNNIPKPIKEILDREITKNIAYTPTLQVINGLRSLADDQFLNNEELKNVLPQSMINWYKTNNENLYITVFGDTPKDIILRVFKRIGDQGKASLKYLHDHKGNIIFGTDTPSSLTYGNPPGLNGYFEMIEMQSAGIPLKDLLSYATIKTAKAYHIDNKYGSIEVNKIANLVILNDNPLETIKAYNTIDKIIIRGTLINRQTLQANTH